MSRSESVRAIVTVALGFLAILILLAGLFTAGHKLAAIVILAALIVLVTFLILWGRWILDNTVDLHL